MSKFFANKVQRNTILILTILVALVVGFIFLLTFFSKSPELIFDESVSESEQVAIKNALDSTDFKLSNDLNISASDKTDIVGVQNSIVLSIEVPVADFYDARIDISDKEIQTDKTISLVNIKKLTPDKKLLSINNNYYLDNFNNGAFFRVVSFVGDDAQTAIEAISDKFKIPNKNTTLSLIQTGTTALTRGMIIKLNSVGNPNHFSDKIGHFLSNADFTHTSNEVSFVDGCSSIDGMSFCAPPAMLDVLKTSGINIIELTGNHNNDFGWEANAKTIKTYRNLGWGTFGGGLNNADARRPFEIEKKKSQIAMFGYNVPCDAISGPNSAGANCFSRNRMIADINSAKTKNQFVIVDFQYFECYAYPDGYVEYPQCDAPIDGQAELFRSAIDAGADMVVGVSAHQPQTFEIYNGFPIYYGLGNLYFDQDNWPGTERGLVLKHYFIDGRYVQTKITPIVYDSAFQPKPMSTKDAKWFIGRLLKSRP